MSQNAAFRRQLIAKATKRTDEKTAAFLAGGAEPSAHWQAAAARVQGLAIKERVGKADLR